MKSLISWLVLPMLAGCFNLAIATLLLWIPGKLHLKENTTLCTLREGSLLYGWLCGGLLVLSLWNELLLLLVPSHWNELLLLLLGMICLSIILVNPMSVTIHTDWIFLPQEKHINYKIFLNKQKIYKIKYQIHHKTT